MTRDPHELPRTARTRYTLLTIGIVLLIGGLAIGGLGVRDMVAEWESMEGGPQPLLMTALGAFVCVFGFGAISADTLGAQSRYVAGETMPTFKRSAAVSPTGRAS